MVNNDNENNRISDLAGYKSYIRDLEAKNIVYLENQNTISDEGELRDQRMKKITRHQEDDFVKLYISDIGYLHGLQPSQKDLLFYFLQNMTYSGMIVLNKTIKEEIQKQIQGDTKNKTKIAMSTIDNAISSFTAKGILIRKGRGTYIANPYLFGKGKFTDILRIRMQLEYTADGVKISTDIEKDH